MVRVQYYPEQPAPTMNPLSAYQNQTLRRYDLAHPGCSGASVPGLPASPNPSHPRLAYARITTTSGQLLTHPERFGRFSLGLQCACTQRPRVIRSRVNLAAFRMSVNQVLGCGATLRRRPAEDFIYKWAYLAPSSGASALSRENLGLKAWIFALDHYDPGLTDAWSGSDVTLAQPKAHTTKKARCPL